MEDHSPKMADNSPGKFLGRRFSVQSDFVVKKKTIKKQPSITELSPDTSDNVFNYESSLRLQEVTPASRAKSCDQVQTSILSSGSPGSVSSSSSSSPSSVSSSPSSSPSTIPPSPISISTSSPVQKESQRYRSLTSLVTSQPNSKKSSTKLSASPSVVSMKRLSSSGSSYPGMSPSYSQVIFPTVVSIDSPTVPAYCGSFVTEEEILCFLKNPEYDIKAIVPVLFSFRNFMKLTELVQKLIDEFHNTPPQENQHPLYDRYVELFLIWFDFPFVYDFIEDNGSSDIIRSFISTSLFQLHPQIMDLSDKITIKKKRATSPKFQPLTIGEAPNENSCLPPQLISMKQFQHLDITSITNYLTIMDFDHYLNIRYWEFMYKNWTRSDKYDKSPALMKFIDHFNNIGKWVATEILLVPSLDTRVKTIENFINIAEKLVEIKNYNTMMAILSGLQSSGVYRLRSTWNNVPENVKLKMNKLSTIMTSSENYRCYRMLMETVEPPAVPFLGPYLTELMAKEEIQETKHNNYLWNWMKFQDISDTLMKILKFQKTPYKMGNIDDKVKYYCESALILTEDQLMEQSLKLEPKLKRAASILMKLTNAS